MNWIYPFSNLVARECRIVQADVSHHGGLSGISKIIDLCLVRQKTFAFHNWGTALETVVDSLIASCFPRETARWLEYPQYAHRDSRVMYPFPLSDEIVPDAPFRRGVTTARKLWAGVEITKRFLKNINILKDLGANLKLKNQPPLNI